MKDGERDTLSWILLAFIVIVAAVGSTIEVPDRYPSQIVNDEAKPVVRFEDGSWSDGYCEAGALCDDTGVTR